MERRDACILTALLSFCLMLILMIIRLSDMSYQTWHFGQAAIIFGAVGAAFTIFAYIEDVGKTRKSFIRLNNYAALKRAQVKRLRFFYIQGRLTEKVLTQEKQAFLLASENIGMRHVAEDDWEFLVRRAKR